MEFKKKYLENEAVMLVTSACICLMMVEVMEVVVVGGGHFLFVCFAENGSITACLASKRL